MTFLASSTASSDLTGKACSPNTIQWVNDAWATGNTTAAAMMARGGKDWYFLTVNYALGQGIEAEATNYIEKHGGKVLGSASIRSAPPISPRCCCRRRTRRPR